MSDVRRPRPVATDEDKTTVMVDKYRLLKPIGEGGMGTVWLAESVDPKVTKRVALKRMRSQFLDDPSVYKRFIAEARIAARMQQSNIVHLIAYGETETDAGREPFFAMEYIEGTNVWKVFKHCAKSGQRLPPAAAMYIVNQAALGLHHAHSLRDEVGRPLGIVHRDVSMSNLLISTDGLVKVADFGVAWAVDNTLQTVGIAPGKCGYMALERLKNPPGDARADVYSLGVVLWELLTGERLVQSQDVISLLSELEAGRFAPPSRVDGRLWSAIDRVVMPAIAPQVGDRTGSALALAEQLHPLIHALSPGFDNAELARVLTKLMPEFTWDVAGEPRPASFRWSPTADEDVTVQDGGPFNRPGDRSEANRQRAELDRLRRLENEFEEVARRQAEEIERIAHQRRTAIVVAVLAMGVTVGLIVGTAIVLQRRGRVSENPTPPAVLDANAQPPHAPDVHAEPPRPPRPATAPDPAAPRACPECASRAVSALTSVSDAVMRCARADSKSVAVTVDFDNARGVATSVTPSHPDGAPVSERLGACVRAAFARAHFTPPEGASGVTRITHAWRVRGS